MGLDGLDKTEKALEQYETEAEEERQRQRRRIAENVKRVVRGAADGQSLDDVTAFLEPKTVWHPIGA